MSRKLNFNEASKLMEELLQDFRKEGAAKESPAEMSKSDDASSEQKELGKSQSAEAAAGSSTITPKDSRTVKDSDGQPDKNQKQNPAGPQAMKAEETPAQVAGYKKIEIGLDNKIARAEALGNAVLEIINKAIMPVEKAASIEKTAEEVIFEKMAGASLDAARDTYDSHLLGQIQRIKDEVALTEANINPEILDKVGGVSGLLDKVAAASPEAVLPAELQAPEAIPAPELPTATGAASAPDVAAGGEVPEDVMNQVVEALDQAGITPDELAQALQEVSALQEAGVQPEELVQALQQMESQKQAEEEKEEPAVEGSDSNETAEEPQALVDAKKKKKADASTSTETPEEKEPVEEKTMEASDVQAARIEAIKAFLSK